MSKKKVSGSFSLRMAPAERTHTHTAVFLLYYIYGTRVTLNHCSPSRALFCVAVGGSFLWVLWTHGPARERSVLPVGMRCVLCSICFVICGMWDIVLSICSSYGMSFARSLSHVSVSHTVTRVSLSSSCVSVLCTRGGSTN